PDRRGEALYLDPLAPGAGRRDRIVAGGERRLCGGGRGPWHVYVEVEQLRPVGLPERGVEVAQRGAQVGEGAVAEDLEPGHVERSGVEVGGGRVLVGAGPVVVAGRIGHVEHGAAATLVGDGDLGVAGAASPARGGGHGDG